MINNLRVFDSHLHIGCSQECKQILETSIYLQKYRLYSSINPLTVEYTPKYLNQLDGFFGIPIVFKEISIEESNKYTRNVCSSYKNAIEIMLIRENISTIDNIYELNILKEHFLLHNEKEMNLRLFSYDLLNSTEGFLILHCRDRIRIDYVKKLISFFPKMNIIIAHMGRDVYENELFSNNIIDNFYSNEHIYFDTSTIINSNIVNYGLKKVGSDRIIFGTDFPYEKNPDFNVKKCIDVISNLKLDDASFEKLMFKNANDISMRVKKIGVKNDHRR